MLVLVNQLKFFFTKDCLGTFMLLLFAQILKEIVKTRPLILFVIAFCLSKWFDDSLLLVVKDFGGLPRPVEVQTIDEDIKSASFFENQPKKSGEIEFQLSCNCWSYVRKWLASVESTNPGKMISILVQKWHKLFASSHTHLHEGI